MILTLTLTLSLIVQAELLRDSLAKTVYDDLFVHYVCEGISKESNPDTETLTLTLPLTLTLTLPLTLTLTLTLNITLTLTLTSRISKMKRTRKVNSSAF